MLNRMRDLTVQARTGRRTATRLQLSSQNSLRSHPPLTTSVRTQSSPARPCSPGLQSTSAGNADGDQISVTVNAISAAGLGITGATADVDAATGTLGAIDTAITMVSTQRGSLGATQNRLESTVRNLSVTSENLSAAESRIRDVDVAEEMMSFTRSQILQQAGTSMLAQANGVSQSRHCSVDHLFTRRHRRTKPRSSCSQLPAGTDNRTTGATQPINPPWWPATTTWPATNSFHQHLCSGQGFNCQFWWFAWVGFWWGADCGCVRNTAATGPRGARQF